jgi:hypothetical protein
MGIKHYKVSHSDDSQLKLIAQYLDGTMNHVDAPNAYSDSETLLVNMIFKAGIRHLHEQALEWQKINS